MYSKISLLVFCVLLLGGCDQRTVNIANPIMTTCKYVDRPPMFNIVLHTNNITSLWPTSSEGYIMSGNDSGSMLDNYWFRLYNSVGEVVWQKVTQSFINVSKMVEKKNGNYVMAGVWRHSTPISDRGVAQEKLAIVVLDKYGNAITTIESSILGRVDTIAIYPTDDGGVILAGRTGGYLDDSSDMWVVKLDSSNAIEWSKLYRMGGYNDISDIKQKSDGGYTVAGVNDGRVLVMILDNHGNIEWLRLYGATDIKAWRVIIEESINNDLIIAFNGHVTKSDQGTKSVFIKISNIGDLLWARAIEKNSSDLSVDIHGASDGGFVAIGNVANVIGEKETQNIWILKYDSQGDVEWQYLYGDRDYSEAVVISPTCDEGYIIAGRIKLNETLEEKVWLYKISGKGIVDSYCAEKIIKGENYNNITIDLPVNSELATMLDFDPEFSISEIKVSDINIDSTDLCQ